MSWGFATPRPLADILTTLKADLEGIKGLERLALNRLSATAPFPASAGLGLPSI